jgi:hypothetical protein
VGPEGYIRKCMDEDFNGIVVRAQRMPAFRGHAWPAV